MNYKSLNYLKIQFIALAILLLAGCCSQVEKIVIVSTNDIHGELDAFPRLATLVEDIRSADTAKVLLVDAGDRWTGNPYTDLAPKRGYPIIELMNTLGYDYSTLGNHEFDNGQVILAERIGDSKFRNLLASMKVVESQFPQLPPYKIFQVGSTKIALLGLLHNYENGHPDGKPTIYTGLEFSDPIESAAAYRSLRDSADLFMAVTHIGVRPDSLLAVEVPELDLIIGGHSHTMLEHGKKVGNTLVTQTGKSLEYAGITTITTKGGKVVNIVNSLVKLDTIPAAPKYQKMVDGYKSNPELARSVGYTDKPLDKTQIMNLITDIIRKNTGSDIAFYNLGGVRVNHFDEGEITVLDIFAMEPFNSVMYTLDMTPKQIKTLLLNKFNSNGKVSQAIDLYPSGADYKIVRGPKGEGIDVVFTPALKTDKKYKVALSDYVSSAYIFDLQGQGTPADSLLTSLLINNITKMSPIKSVSEKKRAEM